MTGSDADRLVWITAALDQAHAAGREWLRARDSGDPTPIPAEHVPWVRTFAAALVVEGGAE